MKRYSVADEANQYVEYDMIQAHTAIPSYSELRLQLLHAALFQSNDGNKKNELFSLVTALVQLGMDTHDLIDTDTNYLSEDKMRSRQLKVLAGDYFSARFYQLLAKAGEIELVGKLSKAVSNVNRHKIMLYERAKSTLLQTDEYIRELVVINSELFNQFTYQITNEFKQAWAILLPLVTEFEVIELELQKKWCDDGYAKNYYYWCIKEYLTDDPNEYKTDEQMIQLVEQLNIKQQLVDKLSTIHHQIKEYIATQAFLQQHLSDFVEQLNLTYSKYVVK